MDRAQLFQLYEDTQNALEAQYGQGYLSETEYDELSSNALNDYNGMLAEVEGFDANYSQGGDSMLAEFNTGNRFGAALLELGDLEGYEDVQDLIEDLAQATNNDPEDIAGLIDGTNEPDDEFALYTAELFGLGEELAGDLLVAAYEARGEDPYAEEDEYEDDDDDEYEDELEALDGAATYSRYSADNRVSQLEGQLAEFQMTQVLKDALTERVSKAQRLVEYGAMPPQIAYKLFGDFELDSDRLAAFSATAENNGVSLEAELYSLDKTLDIFEAMGDSGLFSYAAEDTVEFHQQSNEDLEAEAEARAYVQHMRKAQVGLA